MRTDHGAQYCATSRNAVPDVVAVGIVDFLEVIEIDDEQRHLRIQTLGTGELAAQVRHHEARVGQPVNGSVSDASCVCSCTMALLITAAACSHTRSSSRR